jgi:DNA-binding XRE family transcriptional regulator
VAILPRAEYERLKAVAREAEEDAGTARLIARAKREIAAGTPLLPKDVVDRLGKSENPIRVLRQFREQTQAELSVGVEITQNYLSELETGKRKGPLELHQKIARFLGVPLDLLAPVAVSGKEADPIRFAKRKRVVVEAKRQRGQR